jgi:hypothetical protein
MMPQPASLPSSTYSEDAPPEAKTRIHRDEAGSLEEAVKLSTRPFEKLRDVSSRIGHDRAAWEKSEALINDSEVLSRIPVDEQKRLKHAFQEALTRPVEEKSQDAAPNVSKINTPESDAYLEKTASLIAQKLATIMNEDHFTEKVYRLGELQEENLVMSKHMVSLVDENQALRREIHLLHQELGRFVPAALGLYQKK